MSRRVHESAVYLTIPFNFQDCALLQDAPKLYSAGKIVEGTFFHDAQDHVAHDHDAQDHDAQDHNGHDQDDHDHDDHDHDDHDAHDDDAHDHDAHDHDAQAMMLCIY